MKQQFFFTDIKDHPVAREYYDKYNQIDAAWKCISREAWDRVNKHLLEYAKMSKSSQGLISGSIAQFVSVTFITQQILHYYGTATG